MGIHPRAHRLKAFDESKEMLTCRRSPRSDSARVEATRKIDNAYIITYIQRRYFLPSFFASLSCLRIPFISPPIGTPRNEDTSGKKGEDLEEFRKLGVPASGG